MLDNCMNTWCKNMIGLILLACLTFQGSFASDEHRDAVASFMELCNIYGYKAENHTVVTDDGYILLMFRIPGFLNETATVTKPVALFVHGLIDLADTWITNDADKAPGFLMANAGYDVWFGNNRGTKYSKRHTTLNPSSHSFWQFTLMHMGKYDVPAMVNYALKYTGQKKLVYLGHSEGTTQMFAQLSDNPEFMNKIHIFIALAPVTSVAHIENGLFQMLAKSSLLNMLNFLHVDEFMPATDTANLFYYSCKILNLVCSSVIEFFADMEIEEDNTDRFDVILAHETGGTSTLNMVHWMQLVNYKNPQAFKKFDYGESVNMSVYGRSTPPDYDLSKVPGPIAMFLGVDDRLATPKDSDWMLSQIPKESVVHLERDLRAGHLTFMWGKNMTYFNTAIELADKYSGRSA
jgi:lysosomal acid lipase/cholesteryl ester hydrolase